MHMLTIISQEKDALPSRFQVASRYKIPPCPFAGTSEVLLVKTDVYI